MSIIEQWRKAVLVRDMEKYKRFAGPWRWAVRHDKQQWAERVALEGEQCLCSGEINPLYKGKARGPSVATTEELHCSQQQGRCLHISY